MTLILDSGGVSALAGQRARLAELRRRGHWPPQVPAVVLTAALTGDPRRDFHENQLLRLCQVCDVTEQLARDAAQLRTRTGRADSRSAVDAVVAAHAISRADPVVLTSDPDDVRALVEGGTTRVTVARV
ncbi:MAG: PIN domain-containing protein [Actinomycetota bacterium]|nr:PIN domain-containing protein [Actinomycetota bacterium]